MNMVYQYDGPGLYGRYFDRAQYSSTVHMRNRCISFHNHIYSVFDDVRPTSITHFTFILGFGLSYLYRWLPSQPSCRCLQVVYVARQLLSVNIHRHWPLIAFLAPTYSSPNGVLKPQCSLSENGPMFFIIETQQFIVTYYMAALVINLFLIVFNYIRHLRSKNKLDMLVLNPGGYMHIHQCSCL